MADRTITANLIGHDRMSPAFDNAGKSGDRLHGKLTKLGGLMKGAVVGGAVAAGAGILGLGVFMAQGVKDAAAYQTLQKATAAVLKSTGNAAGTSVKHVDNLASSLESLSGVDETLIVNSQNVLATFTNIRNTKTHDTFDDATKAALNLSVAMHEDLQSATVQVGKALNNPIKGMTALQRVGVTLDDSQKKLITTYMKHGQTAKAQAIILAELNKEFGGAAKAAGQGFAGSMARAKDALSDAGRNLGMLLLPALTKLANWVAVKGVPALVNFAHWVGPKLKEAWAVAVEGGRKVWTFLSGQLWPALQQGYKQIVPALKVVIGNLQAAWKSLSTTGLNFKAIITALWPVLKVIAAVIGVALVAAVVAWSVMLRQTATVIKNVVVPAFKVMVNVAVISMASVLTAIAAVAGVLGHLPGKTGALFRAIHDGAKSAITALKGLRDAVNNVPSNKTITFTIRQKGAPLTARGPGGGHAKGGNVFAGETSMVGERGPELVTFGAAGRVSTAAQTRSLMARAGGDTHWHITIHGAVDPKGTAQAVSDIFNKARSGGWRPPAGTFA